ncbi:glycerophosphodiester phosphodiesterase family protein [Evansella sp. AB-rgal1]|uniref:glycerophosphodiester phosphodiesterase family protein n=1 Tax=Evansella sp. AB-rgal1 TaxID=3242696 RepID=UPI00359F087C
MDIIAHRGNKKYTPENTMTAFYSACTYPIDGIEFDLQSTKDNIPVVIHDEKIDRTTNGRGFVHSFTLRELKQFDAGSWFHERFRGEKIPTFEEVLQWSKDTGLTLHVELKKQKLKTKSFIDTCLNLINDYDMSNSVVISTFEHSYIEYVKEKKPTIRTALLTKTPPFRATLYAKKRRANAIHIRHSYQSTYYYKRWAKAGLPVRVYNVHRLKDALKCFRLQVEAIITDDPKYMTEVLRGSSRL